MAEADWLSNILQSSTDADKATIQAMAEHFRRNLSRQDTIALLDRLLPDQFREIVQIVETVDASQSRVLTIEQVADDFLKDLETEYNPIAFGFPLIDDLLDGGLQAGDLFYLAGRPGVGKTALALQAAVNAAATGKRVVIVSNEMRVVPLLRRIISQRSDVYASTLKRKTLKTWQREKVSAIVEQLKSLPLSFLEYARTVDEIWETADCPDFVMVDYLQKLRNPKSESKRAEVEEISHKLKAGALVAGAAVLCISSLARKSDGTRPGPQQLRESGELEFDADHIGFLWREPDAEPIKTYRSNGTSEWEESYVPIKFYLDKQRDGRTGTVELRFEESLIRFSAEIE